MFFFLFQSDAGLHAILILLFFADSFRFKDSSGCFWIFAFISLFASFFLGGDFTEQSMALLNPKKSLKKLISNTWVSISVELFVSWGKC